MYPSRASLHGVKPSALRRPILELLRALRLVQLEYDAQGAISSTTNLTLINALLVLVGVRGPPSPSTQPTSDGAHGKGKDAVAEPAPSGPRITEPTLWGLVMGTQIAGSLLAFTVRYWLAGIVFPLQ